MVLPKAFAHRIDLRCVVYCRVHIDVCFRIPRSRTVLTRRHSFIYAGTLAYIVDANIGRSSVGIFYVVFCLYSTNLFTDRCCNQQLL